MESLIHVANLLYLVSFVMRDILWLRIFTVMAATLLIGYFYSQPTPLLLAIYWNLAFTALNLYWIVRILLERRPVKLSEEELQLCQMVFHSLKPREMLTLLKLGYWENISTGECFIEAGKKVDRLRVIFSGKVQVEAEGNPVAELAAGQLIGQMSFITDQPAPVSFVAIEPTRCVTWRKSTLKDFLAVAPDLRAAFQAVLGMDLSHLVTAAWTRKSE